MKQSWPPSIIKSLTWKINFKGIINYSALAIYCMLVLNKRANKRILVVIFHLTKIKIYIHGLALKILPHGQLDTVLKTNVICCVLVCLRTLKINFNTSILVGMAMASLWKGLDSTKKFLRVSLRAGYRMSIADCVHSVF